MQIVKVIASPRLLFPSLSFSFSQSSRCTQTFIARHVTFSPSYPRRTLLRRYTPAQFNQQRLQPRVNSIHVRPLASLPKTEERWSGERENLEEAMEADKEVGLATKGKKRDSDKQPEKPEMCTADELHYVPVPGTDWRLALWRYLPPKGAPKRKHPLLMLSGIATNAFCFDLDPKVSLARYTAEAGFDTWILEVRGAGLSKREGEPTAIEQGAAGGVLSGAVQDSIVGATIRGATRATSQMEKHIEENQAEEGDEPPAEKQSTVTGDSNGASLGHTSAPVVDKHVGPSTEHKVEKATGEKKDAKVQKEEPRSSWSTGGITRMASRYKRMVQVNQEYLLSGKYIKKVSSLLERGYWNARIAQLQESLTSLLNGKKSSSMLTNQLSNAAKSMTQLLEEGQRSVSPSVSNIQERLNTTVGSVQEIIELVSKYDWDFDNYLEEDVPAAMEYVKTLTKCPDGKVLGLGHSMGGIILYAMLASRAEQVGLQGAVTVASSLEYGMSDTTLKLLLPFTSPAHLLNIPAVPLGVLMGAVYPLITKSPYPLAWVGYHVSARGMMDPPLFQKLLLTNFCTIPMKLLYHLTTVFQPGGLRNRDGSVAYKDLLKKCKVPVMAIAGDQDMICPPPAVLDTGKVFPNGVTYKLFGGHENRHYGHYDLLCGHMAKEEVFPEVRDFLIKCDG